jgi:hypothetical protein
MSEIAVAGIISHRSAYGCFIKVLYELQAACKTGLPLALYSAIRTF